MSNLVMQLQKNNNDAVLAGNNVIFDEVLSDIGSINYNPASGVITITENGLYMVDWYLVTQSTTSASATIFKLISDQGHEFDSNSPSKTGTISGIAAISVDNAPLNLSLVNESNGTVFFPGVIPAKSNLRIFSLGSNSADSSQCYALEQFAHVLEQLVTIYQGATVTIFSNRLGTVTGPLKSLYKAPNAGSIPMLLLGGPDEEVAFNIAQITFLYFPDSIYDDSITYLPPPDPFPANCETDFIKNIYHYVAVGDNITVTAGPTTSASGDVYINEYGIIVITDETSMIFAMTTHFFSITVNEPEQGLMSKKKSLSISAE